MIPATASRSIGTASFFAHLFIGEVAESSSIGLGSPHFGQGVYFSEAATELRRPMAHGANLYSVDRWFLTTNGVLQALHGRVSGFLNAAVSHLQCGHILAFRLISFSQWGHLTSIYTPCVEWFADRGRAT